MFGKPRREEEEEEDDEELKTEKLAIQLYPREMDRMCGMQSHRAANFRVGREGQWALL